MTDQSRTGFSVVELLIVIAIIGILLAIIVPAVQNVRESARRTDCLNRLQQLGKAVHEFEGVYRTLPPGNRGGKSDASIHTHLLPWLEQMALYENISPRMEGLYVTRSYDFRRWDGLDTIADYAVVTSFLCPSDSGRGLNNYCANVGSAATFSSTRSTRHPQVLGAFSMVGPPTTFSDVTDGLSNTAAMSERLSGSGDRTTFDTLRDSWFSGFELLAGIDFAPEDFERTCGDAVPAPGEFTAFDLGTWRFAGFEFTWYNHVTGPNPRVPNCSTHTAFPAATSWRGIYPARSLHNGGVNMLLLDGSARFVSNEIDRTIWKNLGLAADGNSIGDL